MDKIEISKFIDKAVSKTKNHELHWKPLTNNQFLKLLPSENDTFTRTLASNPLSTQDSYIATFGTGVLTLLVFSPVVQLFTPPDGCELSLRIQDKNSKYAVEISNTHDDKFNASELIRLYNLIDKDSSSVQTLIDSFLDS